MGSDRVEFHFQYDADTRTGWGDDGERIKVSVCLVRWYGRDSLVDDLADKLEEQKRAAALEGNRRLADILNSVGAGLDSERFGGDGTYWMKLDDDRARVAARFISTALPDFAVVVNTVPEIPGRTRTLPLGGAR